MADKWKIRRRIALIAFGYLLIVVPIILFGTSEKITAVTGIASTVSALMGGIVVSYFGFVTKDDNSK